MKKFTLPILLFLTSITSAIFAANEDPFTQLIKKLQEFSSKYPTESIHLHLDKPVYAIGDDIWFKAYALDNYSNLPTEKSKVLYVELIDGNDSLRNRLRLPLNKGTAWGDFKLSDTLQEGNYRIRAYTQYMRNAGPEFYFDKTIHIGNSWANQVFTDTKNQIIAEGQNQKIVSTISFFDKNKRPYALANVSYVVEINSKVISRSSAQTNKNGALIITAINQKAGQAQSGSITATITLPNKQKVIKIIPIKSTLSQLDLQFFAESGRFIENLPNRIAFKAINPEGLGESVEGVIVDNEGIEITSFATSYLGMGSFSINPVANKSYRAVIRQKDGNSRSFELPKVERSGYLMQVNPSDTLKVAIKVLLSEDLVGKGELQLLAQQHGRVSYSVKIPTNKNFAIINLPKAELPQGITTLTLFDGAGIPRAERLIFAYNPAQNIDISSTNLAQSYEKRAPMSLDFMAKTLGFPVQGSFSVAITSQQAIEPDLLNETNILTSLLLKSQLKGYIEKPNAYFNASGQSNLKNLDLLLQTQGWRRIDWKSIESDKPIELAFEPEKDLSIKGSAKTIGGNPIPNNKISLFTSSMGINVLDTLTDAQGAFNFSNLNFPDSTKFVLTALTEKGKTARLNAKINIIEPVKEKISKNFNIGDISTNVNLQLQSYLEKSEQFFDEQSKNGFLNKTIRLDKVDILGEKKQSGSPFSLAGKSKADFIITKKDLEYANLFSTFLSSRTGIPTSQRAGGGMWIGGMTIVLDGMYWGGKIDDLNPIDFESVEVLKSANNTSIYGIRGGYGVLILTTKRGGSGLDQTKQTNPIVYYPKGYAISREFYSPKHEKVQDKSPDLRSTIFWNPAIVSNENGEMKLNFYNGDFSGTYRIVVEGIDMTGNLARKVFTYEVR